VIMSEGDVRIRLPRGALAHLRRDAAMARLVEHVGRFSMLRRGRTELEALVRAIVGQQLSGLAAETIYRRFRAIYPAPAFPSAAEILATDPELLRSVGLSRQKIAAIRDLCLHVDDGRLFAPGWEGLDDETLIGHLTVVRGIGRWSAQMFLMFHCARVNVWPEDDLGIRKGVALLRGRDALPTRAQMREEGEVFAPYCSIAAWYLWRALDTEAQI